MRKRIIAAVLALSAVALGSSDCGIGAPSGPGDASTEGMSIVR